MDSLMSDKYECYFCGYTQGLHRHHIFSGTSNRKNSEDWGCWAYLCMNHHTGNEGVHFNREMDLELKRECQARWEAKYGSREQFRYIFGKSWR